MTDYPGLYLHIPFCAKKCAYCDFYSVIPEEALKKRYIDRLCEEIEQWGARTARPIDTVYLGGGTPSLLLPQELSRIMTAIRRSFRVLPDAEITCEINPGDRAAEFLGSAAACGINRISVGVQSADDRELARLGRRHSFADAAEAVRLARQNGIENVSADIMLGLPDSSIEVLNKSIDGILSLEPCHISAYLLKIEEKTLFGKLRDSLALPDDDTAAEQYLFLSDRLQDCGYEHYEISNFAKPGFQSRHNNKYWLCGEYIGIGPSAHSFFEGKRFFYPRDIKAFIDGAAPIADGSGGDAEEYIMLRLRLSRGLHFSEFERAFGRKLNREFLNKAELLAKHGFCEINENKISLTVRGMLVSNTVIVELLEELT